MKNIKAVLFDSGKVLNYPVTNHWFITPDFWHFVDKNKFDNIKNKRFHTHLIRLTNIFANKN